VTAALVRLEDRERVEVPGVGPVWITTHARARMAQRGVADEDLVVALAADARKLRAALVLARGRCGGVKVALGRLYVVVVDDGQFAVATVYRRARAG